MFKADFIDVDEAEGISGHTKAKIRSGREIRMLSPETNHVCLKGHHIPSVMHEANCLRDWATSNLRYRKVTLTFVVLTLNLIKHKL